MFEQEQVECSEGGPWADVIVAGLLVAVTLFAIVFAPG
jgi:hypothetical protein